MKNEFNDNIEKVKKNYKSYIKQLEEKYKKIIKTNETNSKTIINELNKDIKKIKNDYENKLLKLTNERNNLQKQILPPLPDQDIVYIMSENQNIEKHPLYEQYLLLVNKLKKENKVYQNKVSKLSVYLIDLEKTKSKR